MRLAQGDVEASGSVAEKTGVCVTDVKQYTEKKSPFEKSKYQKFTQTDILKIFHFFFFFF